MNGSLSEQAAIAFEYLLILGGFWAIWRVAAGPAARARRRLPRLAATSMGFSDLLLFVWYVALCGVLLQSIFVSAAKAMALDADQAKIAATLGLQAGLLGGCAAYRFFRFQPAAARVLPMISPQGKGNHPLSSGLVVFLISQPLLTAAGRIWEGLLKSLGHPPADQEMVGILSKAGSPATIALLLAFLVLVAPIAEELIFRGMFFRYARQHLPRWAALLAPSCLFAYLHFNVGSFVPLVVLGVLFSLAYERTGDIRVTMVAHGLFNLNSVFIICAGGGS